MVEVVSANPLSPSKLFYVSENNSEGERGLAATTSAMMRSFLTAAAGLVRLHWLRIDLHTCGTRLRRGGGSYSVLNFSCHRHECLLNVGGVLGRGFQEGNAQLVSVLLRRGVVDHLLVCKIALVPH